MKFVYGAYRAPSNSLQGPLFRVLLRGFLSWEPLEHCALTLPYRMWYASRRVISNLNRCLCDCSTFSGGNIHRVNFDLLLSSTVDPRTKLSP